MKNGRPLLLLVTYCFPPETKAAARRPFQLRHYLPEFGWDVRVLCPRLPSSDKRDDPAVLEVARGKIGEWLRRFVPVDEKPLFEQWSRTSTEGHALPDDPLTSKALRAARGFILPDQHAPWIASVVRAGLADPRSREADLVLSTSPPYSCHVAGYLLARRLGVPLVLDYRDPYSLNAINPPGTLDRPIKERMERGILKRAAAVTAVSEGYARRQAAFAGCEVHAIPNGWEPEDGEPLQAVRSPLADGPLILAHTGTIYPIAHDVAALASGLAHAVSAGVDLRVASCGSGGRFLREALEPLGLADRVDDAGRVSRAEAVQMRAEASAQLLFLPSRPEDEGTIPSKLFDYLVTGQPILAVGDPGSEPGQILQRAGAGLALTRPEEIGARLEALAEAQRSGTLEDQRVSKEGAALFSGKVMAGAFAEILEQLRRE